MIRNQGLITTRFSINTDDLWYRFSINTDDLWYDFTVYLECAQCIVDTPLVLVLSRTVVFHLKSCGSGIMVSDFIDEHNGYLRLTDEEFIQAVDQVDGLQKKVCAFLKYGKEHEGYWTATKLLSQLEVAAKIANTKYPKEKDTECVISLTIIATMEHLLKMR